MKPFCRKTIRIKDFDYSQAGYYYITICVEHKEMLLWSNVAYNNGSIPSTVAATIGRQPLTYAGTIIESALNNIETIYPNVVVDEYVIMPNHIHFILIITNHSDDGRPVVAPTVSRIIQQFKGFVIKKCRQYSFSWQKSYYEHIIRNEKDLQEIREYINENPEKWFDDEYYI